VSSPTPLANAQTRQSFDFGVFGDMGYALDQEPMVDNLLTELNGRQLEFVVNVGDLGAHQLARAPTSTEVGGSRSSRPQSTR
jgi:hypothetical protein